MDKKKPPPNRNTPKVSVTLSREAQELAIEKARDLTKDNHTNRRGLSPSIEAIIRAYQPNSSKSK